MKDKKVVDMTAEELAEYLGNNLKIQVKVIGGRMHGYGQGCTTPTSTDIDYSNKKFTTGNLTFIIGKKYAPKSATCDKDLLYKVLSVDNNNFSIVCDGEVKPERIKARFQPGEAKPYKLEELTDLDKALLEVDWSIKQTYRGEDIPWAFLNKDIHSSKQVFVAIGKCASGYYAVFNYKTGEHLYNRKLSINKIFSMLAYSEHSTRYKPTALDCMLASVTTSTIGQCQGINIPAVFAKGNSTYVVELSYTNPTLATMREYQTNTGAFVDTGYYSPEYVLDRAGIKPMKKTEDVPETNCKLVNMRDAFTDKNSPYTKAFAEHHDRMNSIWKLKHLPFPFVEVVDLDYLRGDCPLGYSQSNVDAIDAMKYALSDIGFRNEVLGEWVSDNKFVFDPMIFDYMSRIPTELVAYAKGDAEATAEMYKLQQQFDREKRDEMDKEFELAFNVSQPLQAGDNIIIRYEGKEHEGHIWFIGKDEFDVSDAVVNAYRLEQCNRVIFSKLPLKDKQTVEERRKELVEMYRNEPIAHVQISDFKSPKCFLMSKLEKIARKKNATGEVERTTVTEESPAELKPKLAVGTTVRFVLENKERTGEVQYISADEYDVGSPGINMWRTQKVENTMTALYPNGTLTQLTLNLRKKDIDNYRNKEVVLIESYDPMDRYILFTEDLMKTVQIDDIWVGSRFSNNGVLYEIVSKTYGEQDDEVRYKVVAYTGPDGIDQLEYQFPKEVLQGLIGTNPLSKPEKTKKRHKF